MLSCSHQLSGTRKRFGIQPNAAAAQSRDRVSGTENSSVECHSTVTTATMRCDVPFRNRAPIQFLYMGMHNATGDIVKENQKQTYPL